MNGRGVNARQVPILLLLIVLLLGGCRSEPDVEARTTPQNITVFAASSLMTSFQEIGSAFEAQNPDVELTFNFAGSQELAQQITEAAPVDVFASADQAQMEVAIDSGRINARRTQIFVHNRLVVIIPSDNPAAIGQLQALARPGLRLVIADQSVPAGHYTIRFLEKASRSEAFTPDYGARVLANVVSYEQNVRAVLTRVLLGEADAGIVYASDATDATLDELQALEIPPDLNTLASYPIAVIEDSEQSALAEAFVAFVLSSQGQERLQNDGFIPITDKME